ncbi:MAG: cytidine deaminase [Lachnospiraceae bacterium]|jgi:cytidine deaminase|nr:cytidine deaminase [Lachnospiraceae bacterium]
MNEKELIRAALEARKRSYSPYSKFQVGAALLTASGIIYTGCNIENAAYSPTNCAERTAFFKAVSDGNYKFQAIAIAGGPEDAETLTLCAPCGVCRQVMMEFCNPKTFRILLAKSEEDYEEFALEELLPLGFGPNNLKE